MALLEQLQEAQKDAMRAKDKLRLGTIRSVSYTHLTLPTTPYV